MPHVLATWVIISHPAGFVNPVFCKIHAKLAQRRRSAGRNLPQKARGGLAHSARLGAARRAVFGRTKRREFGGRRCRQLICEGRAAGNPNARAIPFAGRPARRSPTSRMSCRCRIPAAFKPSKPRVRCSPPEQTSSKTRKSSVRRPAGGIFPERRRSWPENRRWRRPVRCIRASRSRPARARSARLRCSSSDLRRAHICW